VAFATIGNVGAIGCSGSEPADDAAGGEGGEKPTSGGSKASGGNKASGGSKATGGSGTGGDSATGGAAGGDGVGGRGFGGDGSESALEKACRLSAEHQADEAKGTECEVDIEALTTNCLQEPPADECLEKQLALIECQRGVAYSCEEVFPEEPPSLVNTSPECNPQIEAASECARLASTSPICAAYAERGKNVTENLGCNDGDSDDESIYFSIRACERKMATESCAEAAEVLFECLTESPESDWRCADTGAAVSKQSVCGTQRDTLDNCLLANANPTCASFGQWYADTSEAIDCDADLAYAVTSCETLTSEPSCSPESSMYFTCLENSGSYWSCGDESGIYPDGPICAFEESVLSGCRSCTDKPQTTSAQITVTADDQYKLWVNGALVSETLPSWSSAETYTITLDPRPYRPNVIAIEATHGEISTDALDRGAVASVTLGIETFVTDETWLAYEGSVLEADWVLAGYDTSAFVPATSYGEHGSLAPWGEVDGNLNGAAWIWSAGADGLASEKTDAQTVYLRRTFYIGDYGVFSDEPSTCN